MTYLVDGMSLDLHCIVLELLVHVCIPCGVRCVGILCLFEGRAEEELSHRDSIIHL